MTYEWSDPLRLWVGLNIFDGDRRGQFGQCEDQDRVLLGMKLGF